MRYSASRSGACPQARPRQRSAAVGLCAMSKVKGKGRKDDEEARTPLQAVVLADSFTQARARVRRARVCAVCAHLWMAARQSRGADAV